MQYCIGILGLLFVVLKLIGITVVAAWPWYVVLMPFYIGYVIGLAIIIGVMSIGLIGLLITTILLISTDFFDDKFDDRY